MIQQFHFLVSIQRKSNKFLLKTAYAHCSITHTSQVRESPADEGIRGRRERVLLAEHNEQINLGDVWLRKTKASTEVEHCMNSLTNTILVKHTQREIENGSFQGMGRKEKIGSHRSKGTTMQ